MTDTRKVLRACLCLLCVFLAGCLSPGQIGNRALYGYLFTYTRVPFTENLDNTPAALKPGKGKVLQINEPFTGYGLYTRFDSNAIGDIAKMHGLEKVYFADLETFSILGIWTHEKIYLYGE